MDVVKTILEGLWTSLFSIFPTAISVFLVSLCGVVLALAVYRLIIGG